MAQAYLHETSGDGDVIGVDRIEGTLTYVSLLNYAGDDPIAPVAELMPINQPHPDQVNFPGTVAQRYVRHRTESPLCWLVDVIFDFPDRAGFAGWLIDVNFGEETVRRYRDLDGKVVGPHVYLPVPTDPIGPSPYYANTASGQVRLARGESDARSKGGMDILVGATSVILSRTLHRMSVSTLAFLDANIMACNQSPFLAWAPGELLFRAAVIREEPGPMDAAHGARRPLVYPTELHFSVRRPNDDEPEGWRLLRQMDTYVDNVGGESVIYGADDKPVIEEYVRYRQIDFYGLFQALEGAPAKAPAGRVRRP